MTAVSAQGVLVDLHVHSSCSDGALPPELVARRLVEAKVVLAALTDHDTLDGLAHFSRVLHRHGVGCVSGVELTTFHHGEELHVLGYGFDPTHPELLATLRALRERRETAVQSVANNLRRIGTVPTFDEAAAGTDEEAADASSAAPPGTGMLRLSTVDAIGLLHRAGGRAFLAHPSHVRDGNDELRVILRELAAAGLDGIEALYGPDPPGRTKALCALAGELGLLASAGSDAHAANAKVGVAAPAPLWHALRESLGPTAGWGAAVASRNLQRRQFARHIVAPSLLAIGLFAAAIWGILLPDFERALMDRKRELIRELTHAAWSVMDAAERKVQTGALTPEAARQDAVEHIAAMRFGSTNKDYFWIQDLTPRMVLHPDRRELEGQDLRDVVDAAGNRVFIEFADTVRRHGEGYVDYVWQWPGDPRHVGPKESYVRGFAPWGWVIGTGVYLDDVRLEIRRIERGMVKVAAGISVLMVLLLVNMVRYSHGIERERARAVDELGETGERYRQLVEATTEGTLLVVDERCRYANPRLLAWLGYTAAECGLLSLADILPVCEANTAAWIAVRRAARGESGAPECPGELRRRDGGTTRCTLSFAPVATGSLGGLVLVAHDPARPAGQGSGGLAGPESASDSALFGHLPCGVFVARLDRQGTIVSRNPAATRWLPPTDGGDGSALSSLFRQSGAWDAFLDGLRQAGTASERVVVASDGAVQSTLELRAALVRDGGGAPTAVAGTLIDVTVEAAHGRERDALVDRLQTPLLFLHQPVGGLTDAEGFLPADLPVHKAAGSLAQRGRSAALVGSAQGGAVGIVTLRDLCERVVAERRDAGVPLREIMSVPVSTVPANAPVYEALLCMHEHRVHHLGVVAEDGRIAGLVSDRDLLPFQNYGATVLTREIARATLVEDVVRGCRRTPHLVRALLDSGALPRNVTRLVAAVCDAATERFVELAVEELGPPPGRFAFLALGSQSRHEQTLSTDQDNAIVFEPAADEDTAAAYFLELGKRVCGWLTQAGYRPCHGHVMASNRIWCRTVKAWKTHYRYWISSAEPEELQLFSMCFDFRAVAGDVLLEQELRSEIQSALAEAREFFVHFARHALGFKPPVMLFGRILAGAGRGRGCLDLKDAMLPVVAFARLYALRYDIDRTHTLERIDALVDRGLLPAATRDELAAAYEFMMRLRLREQARALREGNEVPDNLLSLRRLGYGEKAMLRQAFAQIRAIQARIGYDFLGGTQ